MIEPLIYATCDIEYYKAHALAFSQSAASHGNKVRIDIISDNEMEISPSEKRIGYCAERFLRLPELLTEHEAVLIVDVDSIFNEKIIFDPEYDMGIFFRPWKASEDTQVLCAASYFTNRAIDFANRIRELILDHHSKWLFDQEAIWKAYNEMGERYSVLHLDNDFLNYDFNKPASIWTAKGPYRKNAQPYLEKKMQYEAAYAA